MEEVFINGRCIETDSLRPAMRRCHSQTRQWFLQKLDAVVSPSSGRQRQGKRATERSLAYRTKGSYKNFCQDSTPLRLLLVKGSLSEALSLFLLTHRIRFGLKYQICFIESTIKYICLIVHILDSIVVAIIFYRFSQSQSDLIQDKSNTICK